MISYYSAIVATSFFYTVSEMLRVIFQYLQRSPDAGHTLSGIICHAYAIVLVNIYLLIIREMSIVTKIKRDLKFYKSSAVPEMGDRGHNRHGPKRGGLLCPFRGEAGSLPF